MEALTLKDAWDKFREDVVKEFDDDECVFIRNIFYTGATAFSLIENSFARPENMASSLYLMNALRREIQLFMIEVVMESKLNSVRGDGDPS